jgi:hypothetical protein
MQSWRAIPHVGKPQYVVFPRSHNDLSPCQTTCNFITDLQCHSQAAWVGLTTYIDIDGTGVIPKEDRNYINFNRGRAKEYMADLDTELDHIPDSASTEDAAHAYFTNCISKAKELFTSKRGCPPKKNKLVLKILNDINSINIAMFHIKEGTKIPQKLPTGRSSETRT